MLLAWLPSPLGPLVAGATDEGVCLLEFTDRRMLEAQFEAVRKQFATAGRSWHERAPGALAGRAGRLLRRRRCESFSVPLVYPGSPFQRRVWEQLLLVPYGETRSYQELASAVGNPAAVRAVGRANGLNRIAIVIPCHRIVNKNGDLGGYGGGLRRKQYLLNLEQVGMENRAQR